MVRSETIVLLFIALHAVLRFKQNINVFLRTTFITIYSLYALLAETLNFRAQLGHKNVIKKTTTIFLAGILLQVWIIFPLLPSLTFHRRIAMHSATLAPVFAKIK